MSILMISINACEMKYVVFKKKNSTSHFPLGDSIELKTLPRYRDVLLFYNSNRRGQKRAIALALYFGAPGR